MEYHTIQRVLIELQVHSKFIKKEEVQKLIKEIVKADRIFLAGAGRSGFVARGFANRLMHLGYTTYFVGDSTTPPIKKDDLIIISSGSGMTSSLVSFAEKAHNVGAAIATVTLNDDGKIARLADTILLLPRNTRLTENNKSEKPISIQPVGSMFEQLSWLVYDSIVLDLAEITGQSFEKMLERHGNLE